MNKFEKSLEIDTEKFERAIIRGEGWIAENEVITQFFSMFPEYDVIIFDQDEIENYLMEKLEEDGIEIKPGDGIEE